MSDEALREAIAGIVADDLGQDHGYLTGYVVVAEWAEADGRRWLTATARDANGDEPPIWTAKGWLYQAIDNTVDDDDG